MNPWNEKVVAAAETSVASAISALLQLKAGAVIGVAPAGAGKSYAIALAVEAVRQAGLRVAVATPTNEQAQALAPDVARMMGKARVTYLHSSKVDVSRVPALRNLAVLSDAKQAHGAEILVGTLSKLGDAFARGSIGKVDILLVDEAYQANSVQYYMIAEIAPRHLLMGDSGQLAPFTTSPDGDRWRGLDEDPLLTAVEVLLRNHPKTKVVQLPITRRLDPRGARVARAFYRDHPFDSAVKPGVRQMTYASPGSTRGGGVAVDRALDLASREGWAHLECPEGAVVSADPATIQLIVDTVARLLERRPMLKCERQEKAKELRPEDIAIAVSHNDQKEHLRAALQNSKLGGVVVNTANKLQGLTYEVVLAWHPLAGLTEVDEFHLDAGRLCVMLTRHRHACIVVGRASDRRLVEGIPPATPSYVGWESNPSLDGWYAHEAVFEALAPYRVSAA